MNALLILFLISLVAFHIDDFFNWERRAVARAMKDFGRRGGE